MLKYMYDAMSYFPPSHFDLELLQDFPNVERRLEVFEGLRLDEVDLVVEFVQLLEKLALRHRRLQDVAADTSDTLVYSVSGEMQVKM